ncbi:MAG: immunoglobulin domain-containing protein [Verrucomicrobiota bacterium]|jgi:hypothetical protein
MRTPYLLLSAIALAASTSGPAQITNVPPARVLVKLVPDSARSRVYALDASSGNNPGTLVALDATNGSTVSVISLGKYPTDMVMTPAGDALYVVNTGSRTVSKVSLDTFSVVAEKSISTPNAYSPTDPLHLALGASSRVYFTDGAWAPNIYALNYNTGASTMVYDAGANMYIYGAVGVPDGTGGMVATRNGSTLYTWLQYGWGAGWAGSTVARLAATAPSLTWNQTGPFQYRDPIDAPILLNASETLLFNKGYMLAAANVSLVLASFTENIYAISADGSLAFGPTAVFKTQDGTLLTNLPFASTVQTVSGNQQKLFRYNSGDGTLAVYDLGSVIAAPDPASNPVPADLSVVNPPRQQLAWTPSRWATSFRVFLGTNQAEVAAADTTSQWFLGTSSVPSFSVAAALTPGSTYYWRVDSVGYTAVTPGPVWSFTVSSVSVSPQALNLGALVGLPVLPASLSLTAAQPTAWTLSVAAPWVSPSATNGTTPAVVTLSVNPTNLAAGTYTNIITIASDGIVLQYPLILQLYDANCSQMVVDPSRDYIYALHPGSGTANDAFVLFLNTDTGSVDRVLPIGINPTDMTVNPRDDHLYVSNWGQPVTRIVDLTTGTEVAPLSMGTDVYYISAGQAWRLVTEGQHTYMDVIDAHTGLSTITIRPPGMVLGAGVCDPTGNFYYHSIGAQSALSKDAFGDAGFVEVARVTSMLPPTRGPVVSLDGTRVFWNGGVYDTNLVLLTTLGAWPGTPAYGCSSDGSVAFGSAQAFDTATGKAIYNLPVTASTLAVDRGDRDLWYFNSATHRLEGLPLALICSPRISQQPAATNNVLVGSNLTLNCTVTGLAPLSCQWTAGGLMLPDATNSSLALTAIQVAQAGDYQLTVSNAYGVVTSAVAHVAVLQPVAITGQPVGSTVLAGQSLELSVVAQGTTPLNYRWTFEGVGLSGATNALLTLTNIQETQEGVYRCVVQNAASAATSAVAFVRVLPAAPAILGGPASQVVGASSNVAFSVIASGSQPLFYQWWFNGAPIPNATRAQYQLNDAQAPNAGAYQVTVSNVLGVATSGLATLAVTPVAPYFLSQPAGTSQPAGGTATLGALAAGSEPIGHQWQLNGTNLPGAGQASLVLSNLSLSDGGDYSLVASNLIGAATSQVATVIVTAAPPLFVQQPLSVVVVAAGASTNLNSLASGSAPLRYQWYFQGAPLLNQTNGRLALNQVTVASAGQYYVTVTNAFGAATSVLSQVSVINQAPIFQQGLTNLLADRSSTVVLSVQVLASGVPTYTWRFNNVQISTSQTQTLLITNIQLAQAGYYRVTVANSYGSVSSTGRVSVFDLPCSVLAWGDDSGGQTDVPGNLDDVVAVAGGDYHTLALRRNGSLLAWGFNGDGQTAVPGGGQQFAAIASGAAHNLAVTASGGVVAWGRNDAGQCNVPSSANGVLAVAAGDGHSLALLAAGTVAAWGDNSLGQVSGASGVAGVRAIAAGRNHNLALRSNGTVAGWGFNAYRQASPPSGLAGVAALAAGYLHSVCLLSNRTVVVWGDNTWGQTNVPSGLSNIVAIAAGDFHSFALRADGTIVGWGDNSYGQLDIAAAATNAAGVASGNYHGLALVPARPRLGAYLDPSGLVIQWSGPGVLQSAPTPLGPYTNLPNPWQSYTNLDMSAPARFFRLQR